MKSKSQLLFQAAAERIRDLEQLNERHLTARERHALEKGQLRIWHLLGHEARVIARQRQKEAKPKEAPPT